MAWREIIELLDARNRVLYGEGVPRLESKYLLSVLLENRQISPVIFFIGGGGKSLAANPADSITADMNETQLSALKVVLLGDLDDPEIGQESTTRLLDFVEKCGCLVVLAAREPGRKAAWPRIRRG